MDHYRSYLRGELARLKNPEIASDRALAGRLAEIGMSLGSPSEMVERFANQGLTDLYVAGLRDPDLVPLTEALSRWRNNSVSRELSPSQPTEFTEVEVGHIRLNDAEPRLHDAFVRNDRLLSRIGTDPEVLADPEYARHAPGDPVDFETCLGKPDPDREGMFRVIDGIHRAIQLFRNGRSRIRLCVFRT